MAKYDGLIIPRSYSEYINKTDAATLSQALQLGGVLDSAPTEDSVKAVKSGGVFDAIDGLQNEINTKQDILTFDNTPTEDSTNPVTSGGIYNALGTKQDTLTFDDMPTADSNNPVKSGGVNSALGGKKIKVITDTYTITSGYVTIDPQMADNKYIPLACIQYGGSIALGATVITQAYEASKLYCYIRNADGSVPSENSTVRLSILLFY